MFDSLNDLRAGVRRVLRSVSRRQPVTRDEIDEEIRFHLREREEHLIARGLDPQLAAREAARRFGEVRTATDLLYRSARRRDHRLALRARVGDMWRDLRYVARSLILHPVFSIGVILTLALGLGVNTAVFRVADHVLFRPPPAVTDPDDVRRLRVLAPPGAMRSGVLETFSYPAVEALQSSGAFLNAAAYSAPEVILDEAGREALVTHVDGAYFATLGIRPHIGRIFTADETRPGAGVRVAVVGHAFWRDRLGARSPIEGEALTITLGSDAFYVVGVAAPEFRGVDADPVDVWLPLGTMQFGRFTRDGVTVPWYRTPAASPLRVIARVLPDATDESAGERGRAALSTLLARDGADQTPSLQLAPLSGDGSIRTLSQRSLLLRLEAVAALVLLIAGANAVNLLFARNLRRRRELAVRMAIGGGRVRITGMLAAESLCLALTGGLGALVAGYWTALALQRLLLPDARWTIAALDERTLIFTGLMTLATGLAAAIAPVRQLRRLDLADALKGASGGRAPTSARLRHALVGVQAAVAATLLIFTGLVLRSLHEAGTERLGFDPAGLVMISDRRFPPPSAAELNASGWGDLIALAQRDARTQVVGLASVPPLGARAQTDFTIPGQPPAAQTDRSGPYVMSVSPEFFIAMGTRVVAGRAFTGDDVAGSPAVAVVNESMARAYWPGVSPLGSCIEPAGASCARVVGIVEDVYETRGSAQAPMRFYLSLAQQGAAPRVLLVRTAARDGTAVLADLQSALPAGARVSAQLVAERLEPALRPWRVAALLFSLFTSLALILACVGVYSTMNYLTLERVREMGIRLAFGASRGAIAGIVVRTAMRSAGVGILCGAAVAALGSRLLDSLLYGVSQLEPAVYVAACALLAAIAAAAALIPAIRATRTDPTITLRAE